MVTGKRMTIGAALFFFLFIWCGSQQVLTAQEAGLKVYGPGGPLGPMKECSEMFSRTSGINVAVTAGPEARWIDQAKQDADLIFGGAEYMLTDFILRHPGFVDETTRVSLYIRAAGILVRKGNPRKIKSLSDLTRDGIKLVDVNGAGQLGLWEDMAGAKGLIPGIQKNIALSVTSSAEAIEKWRIMSELDAWITFESWHYRLTDITDLVQLPVGHRIYRGTPIAITAISRNRDGAGQLVDFLKTEQCHEVFQKWGWK